MVIIVNSESRDSQSKLCTSPTDEPRYNGTSLHWGSYILYILKRIIGQGKNNKESLNNNNIIFQLVSGRARPQGSMFEKLKRQSVKHRIL